MYVDTCTLLGLFLGVNLLVPHSVGIWWRNIVLLQPPGQGPCFFSESFLLSPPLPGYPPSAVHRHSREPLCLSQACSPVLWSLWLSSLDLPSFQMSGPVPPPRYCSSGHEAAFLSFDQDGPSHFLWNSVIRAGQSRVSCEK